jgi:GWxTD domain-containing protein
LLVAILIAAAGLAAAEEFTLPACSPGIPFFCTDASYFKRGDRYWVEVYFSVSNRALQFVRSNRGEYRASADLAVLLFDSGSAQVAGDTQRLRLSATKYEETTSADSVRTGVMSFPAPPGEYSLTVSLSDRDTNMRSGIEVKFDIPKIGELPSVSDIRFEEPGTRGASRVYPNVRRSYKGELSTIPFYFEVYAGEEHLPVDVVYRVMVSQTQAVYEDTVTILESGVAPVEADIPADAVSNGFFNLVVGIPGEGDDFVVARAKVFEVRSLQFYWGKDVQSALDLLSYIASGSFLDQLEEASPEERKVLWEEFWKEKDPTPDTQENEFYDEHVRRFDFANSRFGTAHTSGWETDRGRIYIIYGQPDQIESYPYDPDQDATEVWHYNSLGRHFVFVDRTGFGDYRLTDEY